MNKIIIKCAFVITLLLISVSTFAERIESISFTKIADTNTPIPNGSDNFTVLGNFGPSISNKSVTFSGTSVTQSGIYVGENEASLSSVVDMTSNPPGSASLFSSFTLTSSISNGNIVFGGAASGNPAGIYSKQNNVLSVIADRNTSIPNGVGSFTDFTTQGASPSIENNNITFLALGLNNQRGIYASVNNVLSRIADTNTTIPNQSVMFTSFQDPSIAADGAVVFEGRSGFANTDINGIYTNTSGVLSTVVDNTMAIPGGSGNFSIFTEPSIYNDTVAFVGSGVGAVSVFRSNNAVLEVVADQSTPVPGFVGTFSNFANNSSSSAAISKCSTAFQGVGGDGVSFRSGIYIDYGMGIEKVIDAADTLGGQAISSFFLGPEGVDENQLAFVANFAGSGMAVYRADITLKPSLTLASSLLPVSRSAQVGQTATVFASLINAGAQTQTGCRISPRTEIPSTFSFQTTDANNNLIGTPDTPIDIPAGGIQNFVVSFTPSSEFAPNDVVLDFECDVCDGPAASVVGLNTLLLSANNSNAPDVIGLTTVVDLQTTIGSTSLFAVGSANVGGAGDITVSLDDGGVGLPLNLTVCQTDLMGACVTGTSPSPTVTINYGAGGTESFAVFAQPTGSITNDPANNRIFIRFTDTNGIVRGATSTAVRTL